MLENILSLYDIQPRQQVSPFGSGLINHTWKISTGGGDYILQRINQDVFKQPKQIARNIQLIADYLAEREPAYLFPAPVKTIAGSEMAYIDGDGYYRLFPFVSGSSSMDVVGAPQHGFEAGRQFGRFTRLLADFPVSQLETTIPDFHNLILRYAQFEAACKNGNPARLAESKKEIACILNNNHLVHRYEDLLAGGGLKKRVTHHDTKISNVLFDDKGYGLCVVDLDTIMPGYFLSDVGDMMRTYLSPVSEEEKDFSLIRIRDDYFAATIHGYLLEMLPELTDVETEQVVYAGMFMIYMQAIRFLTDYLNDDVYYGASYEKHNYVRASNQIVLLQRMLDKEDLLEGIVRDVIIKISNPSSTL